MMTFNMCKVFIWLSISLATFSALSCDLDPSDYKKLKVATNKNSIANTTNEPSHGVTHEKGVNIMGNCENPNCETHGEKAVLNLGYGEFKIIQRGQVTFKSFCPVCNSSITPKSYAFNNCYYRVRFIKEDGYDGQTPWKNVGNEYEYYEETRLTDTHKALKIECRGLGGIPPEEDDDI